jgi:hypothetical protein
LRTANRFFHDAYCNARDDIGQEIPTLVLMPRELVLHRLGERRAYPYSRAFFDAAKAAAHVAVALFALSQERRPPDALSKVESLRTHLADSLGDLKARSPGGAHAELVTLLEACLAFADCVLRSGANPEARETFARETGPEILRITELATCQQIASLHDAVQAALEGLAKDELSMLQVVVVGDHQARSLSLGMQYFQRRLLEKDGSDEQVTYGENVSTEQEALALVGTRRLDKGIARAFFGDEKRLQRDVLGDAAAKCLAEMNLPPLVQR